MRLKHQPVPQFGNRCWPELRETFANQAGEDRARQPAGFRAPGHDIIQRLKRWKQDNSIVHNQYFFFSVLISWIGLITFMRGFAPPQKQIQQLQQRFGAFIRSQTASQPHRGRRSIKFQGAMLSDLMPLDASSLATPQATKALLHCSEPSTNTDHHACLHACAPLTPSPPPGGLVRTVVGNIVFSWTMHCSLPDIKKDN